MVVCLKCLILFYFPFRKDICRGVKLFRSQILLDRSQLKSFCLFNSEEWKQQGSLTSHACYCCCFYNGGKKKLAHTEISAELPKYSFSRSLLCEGYLEIILWQLICHQTRLKWRGRCSRRSLNGYILQKHTSMKCAVYGPFRGSFIRRSWFEWPVE